MSKLTSFVIVGAGGVGRVVADELLKKSLRVTILTRDDTLTELQAFKDRGAVLAKVDYAKPDSLKAALAGSEAVVCTVGSAALGVQFDLARAAKAAGVELFVPAEFGVSTTGGPKKMLQDLLKDLGLPYALFFSGLFYQVLPSRLSHDYAQGKMQVVGHGTTKFSLTSRDDVGKFVAHVLSTAPKSALQWATIPFEGDRKSPLEIAALAEKKLGKRMELTFIDVEDVKKLAETDFAAFLLTVLAEGRGVSGTEEEVAAAKREFFPEWSPTPYEEFIA